MHIKKLSLIDLSYKVYITVTEVSVSETVNEAIDTL